MTIACSLKVETRQTIPPNTWTALRFDQVLRNDLDMWRGSDLTDPQSALIYPPLEDYYLWAAMVHWEPVPSAGSDLQFLEQFCRDPYSASPDTTGTDDSPDTAGAEYNTRTWPFVGRPGQPVAVRVWHNHTAPVRVVLAEFKAITWTPAPTAAAV